MHQRQQVPGQPSGEVVDARFLEDVLAGRTNHGGEALTLRFELGVVEATRDACPGILVRELRCLLQHCVELGVPPGFCEVPKHLALVFVDEGDRAKIGDFGIARFLTLPLDVTEGDDTSGGHILGSPGYMAPEQVAGQPCDERTDAYALGLILYEMRANRPAYLGTTPLETMGLQVTGALPELPVGAPLTVSQLIHACLAKNPEHRLPGSVQVARRINDELSSLGEKPR